MRQEEKDMNSLLFGKIIVDFRFVSSPFRFIIILLSRFIISCWLTFIDYCFCSCNVGETYKSFCFFLKIRVVYV